MRTRVLELMRFGSVGAVAFVVDAGLFNLLMFGPGELLGAKPLTAKVVSATVATLVAWLGSRYWTFPDRRRRALLPELVGFALVNAGGMAIAVGCLAVSRYLMGLTSPLADNISANVVGLVLGTLFRYLAYRGLVFPGPVNAASALGPEGAETVAASVAGSDSVPETAGETDASAPTGANAVATAPAPRT